MADSEDRSEHVAEDEKESLEAQADQEGKEVDENRSPEDLAAQLTLAQEEIEALKDQALRGQAEAENVRRRAARDVENAHKFALEKFAADLLPVIDSLEKAVESAQQGAEGADSAAKAIGEGVELSLKLFHDVLEKAGVNRIYPAGEPFDPQLHEAMAMVENPDAEPSSVLDVMQAGYTLNGRLVRAAMVVVSKAPADG
ncbi:MAG: nucleotide exchange factor GrpE [Gammaproteobacteria bacterium]|jgi:molecular chaperone GrpE|nr:MAG: nucleotide exchange factor GrpE [Gammaproteobacteria bacterium]